MPSFDTDISFNPKRGRFRLWTGTSTGTANGWFPFIIPKNASLLIMIAGGGGAGGGGGFTAATTTVKSGGGGGGCGACARIIVPAPLLPKDIYICPGAGGAGSTGSGVAGSNGNRSFISCNPNSVSTNDIILASGAAGATGGPAGTSAAAAGGETIATNILGVWNALGLWNATVGIIGGASSITANSAAVAWGAAGLPWSPGTGGAGATAANAVFNGGQLTGASQIPTIAGGIGVAGGPGGAGNPGLDFQNGIEVSHGGIMWAGMGGTGGGSSATAGTGGVGGAGRGFCSGGGGGGAGVTGAAGGNGASGFVYIGWW